MSAVYFKTQDSSTIVTMDGETSIKVSKTNSTASASVMSNRTVGTDLIEGDLVVDVQGVITYSKSPSQTGNPTPSEWVTLIDTAISNKRRFTLYATKYEGGSELLKDYSDMVIASYSYVVDKYEDTITADISFKQIFVTDAAETTYLEPQRSTTAVSTADPSKGGSSTSTETTEEETKTISRAVVDMFSGYISGD